MRPSCQQMDRAGRRQERHVWPRLQEPHAVPVWGGAVASGKFLERNAEQDRRVAVSLLNGQPFPLNSENAAVLREFFVCTH